MRKTILFCILNFLSFIAFSQTWQSVGLGGGGANYAFSASPVDKNFMVASCDMGGVYRSLDGGTTWNMINWHQIHNSVANGFDSTFMFHPTDANTVYGWGRKQLGAYGMLRSTDKGVTWNYLVTGAPWGTTFIDSMYISRADPNLLFVGAGNKAYRSVNGGTTFTACLTVTAKVTGFNVSAKTGSVFAAADDGLYKSINNGVTWSKIFNDKLTTVCGGGTAGRAVVYFSKTDGVVAGSSGGNPTYNFQIVKSEDDGATFVTIRTYNNRLSTDTSARHKLWVACAETDPDKAFVNAYGTVAVHKTTDSGTSWTEVLYSAIAAGNASLGWLEYQWNWALYLGWTGSFYRITVCPTDPNIIMGTNSGGSYMTSNGGSTWRCVSSKYEDVLPYAPSQKWSSTGFEVTAAWDYVINPYDRTKHYILNSDIGMQRSDDSGSTWRHAAAGSPWGNTFYQLAFDPDDPAVVYAAASDKHEIPTWIANTDASLPGGVVKSTNAGALWANSSTGLSTNVSGVTICSTSIVMDPSDKALYVAMYGDGVYKSVNRGVSWTRTADISVNNNRHVYYLKFGPDGALYCVVTARRLVGTNSYPDKGGIFKTTDKGVTWTNIASGKFVSPVHLDFHPTDSRIIYVTTLGTSVANFDSAYNGVYKTVDGGEGWSRMTAFPGVDPFDVYVDQRDPSIVYAGCDGGGGYVSYDSGTTWSDLTGLPYQGFRKVSIDYFTGNVYYCTGGGGVFKYGSSPVVVDTGVDPFANLKSYPNPCRIGTSFRNQVKVVGMPEDSVISIFSAGGELVRTLPATGGSIFWDGLNTTGDNVPQGVYIYKIISGAGSKTGKIAILR